MDEQVTDTQPLIGTANLDGLPAGSRVSIRVEVADTTLPARLGTLLLRPAGGAIILRWSPADRRPILRHGDTLDIRATLGGYDPTPPGWARQRKISRLTVLGLVARRRQILTFAPEVEPNPTGPLPLCLRCGLQNAHAASLDGYFVDLRKTATSASTGHAWYYVGQTPAHYAAHHDAVVCTGPDPDWASPQVAAVIATLIADWDGTPAELIATAKALTS